MQQTTARIPVRSKREAMDWSLVLMSQGIAASIENSAETGWELSVAAADYEPAQRVLSQYREENRRWPWGTKMLERGLIFDWSSLAWGGLVCFFFLLSVSRANLTSVGVMDSVAVRHGQWWRLFTAVWLHADLAHLAGNATIGTVLLGLAMARYGTGVALLAGYLAGVGGNIASLLVSVEAHRSLGASGMAMGALGLLAVHSFGLWRRMARSVRYAAARLVAGVMLFILLGVAPGTDIVAHLGGFIGGVLLGSLASSKPSLAGKQGFNLASGLVFAWLVAWPWWLGLHQETIV